METSENIANVVRESRSTVSYSGVPVSKKSLPSDIAGQLDSIVVGSIVGPTKNVADNTMSVLKYIAKVQQPDSVEYRLITVQGIDEKAKKTADSIYTALQTGAPIDTIAKQYNQAAAAQWITSAMVGNNNMRDDDRKFVETLFTTPAGTYQKLELAGGTFVIKVTDRRNFIDKYDVAIVKRPIDFSEDTHNTTWNKFSSFLAANPKMEDIEANAAKEGYTVQTAQYVSSSDHYIANVHSTTDALRWTFNKSTKVGDVSELYEAGNANDQLMVVMLTAIHPKGLRDFNDENLQNILKEEVIKEKKAAKIIEKMQSAKSVADVAKMAGAVQDTVSHITFAAPVFVQKVASSEPILSGAATAAQKGQFVNGVKGEGAVYAFQVLGKNKLEGKFDQKQEEAQLTSSYARTLNGLMQTLARKAKVVDERYKFYQ